MTEKQYRQALEKHGFRQAALGYVELPGVGVHVWAPNAGPRRRARLAYLLAELNRAESEAAKES